ncbi:hypothetical protein ACFSYD_13580 [Paracoccus aerius]
MKMDAASMDPPSSDIVAFFDAADSLDRQGCNGTGAAHGERLVALDRDANHGAAAQVSAGGNTFIAGQSAPKLADVSGIGGDIDRGIMTSPEQFVVLADRPEQAEDRAIDDGEDGQRVWINQCQPIAKLASVAAIRMAATQNHGVQGDAWSGKGRRVIRVFL